MTRPPLPRVTRPVSALSDADLAALASILAARLTDSGLETTVEVLREAAKRIGGE